jgi:hypothetical protein
MAHWLQNQATLVGERGATAAQPAVMAMPDMQVDDAVQATGAPAAALSDDLGPSTGRDGAGIVEAPVREAVTTADLARAGFRAGRALQGHIEADGRSIKGWVWDPTTPAERIRLVLLDGETRLATTVASENRPGLILSGIGDGRHGFSIELADGLIAEGRHVLHLRCADTGAEVPGSPLIYEHPNSSASTDALVPLTQDGAIPNGASDFAAEEPAVVAALGPRATAPVAIGPRRLPFRGHVDGVDSQWRLSGWAYDPSDRDPLDIQLVEDDVAIAAAKANDFRADLVDAGVGDGHCAFYIRIPGELFDGTFHNLRVYAIGAGRREAVGRPFGIVLPRLGFRKDMARPPVGALKIFEQITGISAPSSLRPSSQTLDQISTTVQELSARFGHAAALGLLYAYVLRRPIDNEGLVTRLTRIDRDLAEYRTIVEEVMYSEEAVSIHGSSRYMTLHPLESLRAWLGDKFGILEISQ